MLKNIYEIFVVGHLSDCQLVYSCYRLTFYFLSIYDFLGSLLFILTLLNVQFFWLFSSIYYFLIAILTITGNITESDRKKGQVLDTLKVERERGKGIITSIYVYRHFAEY